MLEDKAKKIKMFIMDVDGVLTDGRIVLGNGGEELKFFHVVDGVGINLAHRAGLRTAIISARRSSVTSLRAKQLGIEIVYQVNGDKREAYEEILKQHHLQDEEVAYIGDDLHDFPILKRVGLSLSVPNGREEIKEIVDCITKRGGGQGAVREAIEIILKAQGKWEEVTRQYKVPA